LRQQKKREKLTWDMGNRPLFKDVLKLTLKLAIAPLITALTHGFNQFAQPAND
jgi:hypothetical protein